MAKPVAVQLYSLREEAKKDFVAVLKRVAAMGYQGVEYAGLHGMSAQEVGRIVQDLGLKSTSAHAPLPTRENIQQIAAEAEALGYRRIVTGFGPKDMETEDGVKACAEKFAAGCEVARSAGLSLGMHNHWWEFDRQFNGRTPYEIILEAVPDLFSELDIYWCTHGGGDLPAVTRKWARRIPLMHVKDGDLTTPPVHKAVGDGKVPTKAGIRAADPKVLEWLIVELDTCATDMAEAVEKSLRWLVKARLGQARKQ